MTIPWPRALLLTTVFFMAGAATAQDRDGADKDHPHAGRHHEPLHGGGLFVSPCGRPYRAGPADPYPVAAWFAEADTDHDGFLERAELRADAAAFFAVLDRNHDGVIDTDEVDVYEHTILPELLRGRSSAQAQGEARLFLAQFGGGGSGGGRGGGHHRGSAPSGGGATAQGETLSGAAAFNLLAEPEPVTAADTAFNGRITLAEFIAAADRHFDALDVRGAGKIALADLPKTAIQQRRSGGGGRNVERRHHRDDD